MFQAPILALSVLVVAASSDDLQLEEGFVRWDNGQDLTGWYASHWNGQPTNNPAGWSVIDGAIHLNCDQAGSHLFSKQTFSRNAVIRLQFRATKAADSGLNVHGKQFQVRDYPNSLPDTQAFAPHCRPPGEWNDLELDIIDGAARISLNGQVIVPAWPIGEKRDLGLGLQREKGDFDFRYIRVKERR